ncbi:MAG: DUF2064 domain-containing protein [Xanthobacteraceae bacterium]
MALQSDGDLGKAWPKARSTPSAAGHAGAILVNLIRRPCRSRSRCDAVDAARSGDNVTLSPAIDGGYTLIGLSRLHLRLFEDIAWSTPDVHRQTLARAEEIGLPVVNAGLV